MNDDLVRDALIAILGIYSVLCTAALLKVARDR